jgi:hypothetical protein
LGIAPHPFTSSPLHPFTSSPLHPSTSSPLHPFTSAPLSPEAGLTQMLAYMLSNPNPEKPSYGTITSGGSFIFLKLVKGEIPQYATSKVFVTRNPGNELYDVLRILRHFSQIVINS